MLWCDLCPFSFPFHACAVHFLNLASSATVAAASCSRSPALSPSSDLPLFLRLFRNRFPFLLACKSINVFPLPISLAISLLFSLGTLTQHSDEVAGGWSSSRCAAPGHGLVPICLSRLFNYFCRLLVAICQLLPRPRPLLRKMLLHLDVRLLPVSSCRNTLSAPPPPSLSLSVFVSPSCYPILFLGTSQRGATLSALALVTQLAVRQRSRAPPAGSTDSRPSTFFFPLSIPPFPFPCFPFCVSLRQWLMNATCGRLIAATLVADDAATAHTAAATPTKTTAQIK